MNPNAPTSPADLITNVTPPQSGLNNSQDLSNVTVFGPFPLGSMVRVTVGVGGAWFTFGNEDVTVTARTTGAPIGPWDRQDFRITSENMRYVAMLADTAGPSYGIAYQVGAAALPYR